MWSQLFWPGTAFAVSLVAALALRGGIAVVLRRWAGGRSAFLDAIRLPSYLWCIVLAMLVAIEVSDVPARLGKRLELLLTVAIIVSVTLTVAGILGGLIARAGERSAVGGRVSSLGQTTMRVIVMMVGLLVLLDALGIQIAPLLTALGVGGLAVALALQDTLSNLFAGMHILADKPIRVGDYVKLADGVEGYVVDVSWRSTRVRTLPNTLIVVPNSKVAQAVITNYDLPSSNMALSITVNVSYAADPDHVVGVLVDEASRAAGQVPGLLGDPKPFARFIPGFGESSLGFTLICQVASFVDQYAVQDELRKRILRRFRQERIDIPFPVRTVELRSTNGAATPADRALER